MLSNFLALDKIMQTKVTKITFYTLRLEKARIMYKKKEVSMYLDEIPDVILVILDR